MSTSLSGSPTLTRRRLFSGVLGLALAAGVGVAGGVATEMTSAPLAAHAASTRGGTITRSEVLARAQNWVDRGVTYGSDFDRGIYEYTTDVGGVDTYRQDCSGLVSMAWHLTWSPTTSDFAAGSVATSSVSSPDAMLPGDAVLFPPQPGHTGHIEIFAGWRNTSDHTEGAWSYSLNGPYHNDWAKGPTANSHGQVGTLAWSEIRDNQRLRYNNIVDDTGGLRIGVVHNDSSVYVKEGALSAGWSHVTDGGTQVVVSGNRIGVLHNDSSVYVKEGALTAGWSHITDGGTQVSLG